MKYLILNKRSLMICASLVLGAAVLLTAVIGGIRTAIPVTAAERKLPIYSVGRADKVAALSFDAAWGNEDTQQLIDILGKYGVSATFFVVGDWVEKYPESVRALADAGHEVMNHSDDHPHMPQLSREEMRAQIRACDDKIEQVTGVRPILFRPPYGDYDNALIETLEEESHYCIQWDVDSLDWKDLSAPEITDRVLGKVAPGSIILFHNAAKHTPEALPGIIEALQADGYRLMPVSQLIFRSDYTIDHTGRQISDLTAGGGQSSGSDEGAQALAPAEDYAVWEDQRTELEVIARDQT